MKLLHYLAKNEWSAPEGYKLDCRLGNLRIKATEDGGHQAIKYDDKYGHLIVWEIDFAGEVPDAVIIATLEAAK